MTGDWSVIPRIGQLFPRGQTRGASWLKVDAIVVVAALFSNPAVVIGLGLVSILQHLVEVKGFNVNACSWNSFDRYRRLHLLLDAMLEDDLSCFEYLLSIDGGSSCSARGPTASIASVIEAGVIVVLKEISPVQAFRALVEHPTFDPVIDGVSALHLIIDDDDEEGERETKNELIRILMRVGEAAPVRSYPTYCCKLESQSINFTQYAVKNVYQIARNRSGLLASTDLSSKFPKEG